MINNVIFISLLAAFTFGFVDVINIFIIEKYVHPLLKKQFKFEDDETLSIISGSLAANASILTAIFIEMFLEKQYNYIKTPLIDVVGLIIGTVMFLFILKMYTRIKKYIKRHFIKNKKN